ncbi:MAG: hypothetical protein J5I93_17820 [Pirellulaceae bacterium]|nr:hypothetical protein [Pirellulaceae bacterium]
MNLVLRTSDIRAGRPSPDGTGVRDLSRRGFVHYDQGLAPHYGFPFII